MHLSFMWRFSGRPAAWAVALSSLGIAALAANPTAGGSREAPRRPRIVVADRDDEGDVDILEEAEDGGEAAGNVQIQAEDEDDETGSVSLGSADSEESAGSVRARSEAPAKAARAVRIRKRGIRVTACGRCPHQRLVAVEFDAAGTRRAAESCALQARPGVALQPDGTALSFRAGGRAASARRHAFQGGRRPVGRQRRIGLSNVSSPIFRRKTRPAPVGATDSIPRSGRRRRSIR